MGDPFLNCLKWSNSASVTTCRCRRVDLDDQLPKVIDIGFDMGRGARNGERRGEHQRAQKSPTRHSRQRAYSIDQSWLATCMHRPLPSECARVGTPQT